MTVTETDVLIVGSGPVGLITGTCMLLRHPTFYRILVLTLYRSLFARSIRD